MKNKNTKEQVNIEMLAASFGTTEQEVTDSCKVLLNQMDPEYSVVSGTGRDDLILEVLTRIDSDTQKIGAPERTERWQSGWQENLTDFRKNAYNLATLTPKFIRRDQPIRFNGDYIVPNEPHFEHLYFNLFREWLFDKYFSSYDTIYDIGCGSSYNLSKLCRKFPEKKVYGFDFVQSSVDIVNDLALHHGFNSEGRLFNLIEPDFEIELEENSLVFTSGVIEQVASKFEKFIDFLLEKKPSLVINIEPTYEVYEQDRLFDYLAAKFHKKRGYTQGYLPRLRELEKQGKVEILKVKRLNFGSLFMEGFTYMVWRPI